MKGRKAHNSQLCTNLTGGIMVAWILLAFYFLFQTRNNRDATIENSNTEEQHEHHAGERSEQREQKTNVVPTQTKKFRQSSLPAALATGMEAKARELEAKKGLLGSKTTSLRDMFHSVHGRPLQTTTTQPSSSPSHSSAAPSPPPPAPIHESLHTKANLLRGQQNQNQEDEERGRWHQPPVGSNMERLQRWITEKPATEEQPQQPLTSLLEPTAASLRRRPTSRTVSPLQRRRAPLK